MTVHVCMYVRERERERETRCILTQRIRKLNVLRKEKDSTQKIIIVL